MRTPRKIPDGGTVALVAPAGPLAEGAVERAEGRVRSWGYRPRTGPHARGRVSGYLAGTDDERAGDLQAALDSDADAIWFLRGGYGTMRILDRIDWTPLRERPRPVIGYSDNTAIHLALLHEGVISYHGPHAAADPLTRFSERCLRRVAFEGHVDGVLPLPDGTPAPVVGGTAEGVLVGGNLALLGATLGTPYALPADGALLFMEEVGEPLYRIDRLLAQLRLAGVLDRVRGVLLGAFTEIPGKAKIGPLFEDRLGGLGVPVLAGCPFGHVDDNWTLPVGARARLDAEAGTLTLLGPSGS